jgi:penicillin-binding protein 1A
LILKRILRVKKALFIFGIPAIFLSLMVYLLILYLSLPSIEYLQNYKPPLTTKIYSYDGKVIGELFRERRDYIPLEKIPAHLINAFIASEDADFFKHKGVNLKSLIRATFKNIEAGSFVQGGSTITQQLAKRLLLTPEKKISRKIKEIFLALKIEKGMSKQKILELYLNHLYLGGGAYGVAEGARTYFRKPLSELTIGESALLAGLLKAPSYYSPQKNPSGAKARQIYVLERMLKEGFINEKEYESAVKTPLRIYRSYKNPFFTEGGYFAEEIRKSLVQKYGEDLVYTKGLRVWTSMNLEHQMAGIKALKKGLEDFDRKKGFRGVIGNVKEEEWSKFLEEIQNKEIIERAEYFDILPDGGKVEYPEKGLKTGEIYTGLITDLNEKTKEMEVRIGFFRGTIPYDNFSWALKDGKKPSDLFKKGDLISVRIEEIKGGKILLSLYQKPVVQGALLCIENSTGFVTALVGGYEFTETQFNRAIQAKRQVGSAFKPIIYATAITQGFTPASVIEDMPVAYEMPVEEKESEEIPEKWKPLNYDMSFRGEVTIAEALAKSINLATIRLLSKIGVRNVIELAKSFGIESPLPYELTLGLGSASLSLLEITRAYSVFPNKGLLRDVIFVKKIEDWDGKLILENVPVDSESYPSNSTNIIYHIPKPVYPPDASYIMVSLLQGVVRYGTGWKAKALGRPVAGKTGTTNDFRDVWFIGFTPDFTVGVWVGYDDLTPLGEGETGSAVAAPVWVDFMKEILKNVPPSDFSFPDNIVFRRIDPFTGYLAKPGDENSILQAFIEGTEPQSYYEDYMEKMKGF